MAGSCGYFAQSMSMPPQSAGSSSAILSAEPPSSFPAVEKKQSVERLSMPQSAYYTPVRSMSGYDALPSAECRTLYRQMEEAAYDISQEKNEQGRYPAGKIKLKGAVVSEAEIRLTTVAFRKDHPEIFWLSNVFGFSYSAENTLVVLYASYAPDEITEKQRELVKTVGTWINELEEGWSEFDRELYLHDRLLFSCVYDTKTAEAGQSGEAFAPFSVYGALVEGKAVCEGYAAAMQLLLGQAGIESRVVSGRGENQAHAWNLVRLEEEWYHLDATWNDGERIRYDYFNISDEILAMDHQLDRDYTQLTNEEICGKDGDMQSFNWNLPICNTLEQNYFTRRGVLVTSFTAASDTAMLEEMIASAREQKGFVCFVFGEKLNYDHAVEMMFQKKPYKMLYLLNRANDQLPLDQKIDADGVTYHENRALRAVTVFLPREESNGS